MAQSEYDSESCGCVCLRCCSLMVTPRLLTRLCQLTGLVKRLMIWQFFQFVSVKSRQVYMSVPVLHVCKGSSVLHRVAASYVQSCKANATVASWLIIAFVLLCTFSSLISLSGLHKTRCEGVVWAVFPGNYIRRRVFLPRVCCSFFFLPVAFRYLNQSRS